MNIIKRFFDDVKFAVSVGILALIVFAGCLTWNIVNTESSVDFPAQITISGKGEVVATPDVATFTYTIREVSETVETAQDLVAQKSSNIISLLKASGVEDKDIKTTSYNVYPKHEWQECEIGIAPCRGKSVVVGQEVSESVEVKVRNTDEAGNILSMVGGQEVANISGLNLSIDDIDGLKEQARSLAIENAKEKATTLSAQLGVKIEKIVNFSESNAGIPTPYFGLAESKMASMDDVAVSEIMTGEDEVVVNVNITFQIEN